MVAENPRGLLLVAEVSAKDARQVAMLPWIRVIPAEAKPRIRIVARPVWSQDEPVLDLALLDSGSQLLVLSPGRVVAYRMVDGKWMAAGQASLSLARPVARDPRGRLAISGGSLRAYLPGTTCTADSSDSLRFTCAANNEEWPLNPRDPAFEVRWITDRNVLESPGAPGEFFNAAAGLFASVDGQVRNRQQKQLAGAERWGSDLASIENPCGSGTLVVASAADDAGTDDHVQVFETTGGQAATASEPLALPGTVTALWSTETPGEATLVVRNSKTGTYEASRLGLACAE